MLNVLNVMPLEEKHRQYLEQIGTDCIYTYATDVTVTASQVKEADIIMGNVPATLVAQSDKVKWMQLNSAGADVYCKPGVLGKDTVLTCATGAYGLSVSEYMLTMTIMLCRKMDLYARHQVDHEWKSEGRVTSIWGSTVLVLGLGDIGGEYAQKMKALGSYVIGVRRKPSAEVPEYLDELHTIDDIDELLPRADIVAMVLPGTPATCHIIDEKRLGLMKKDAILINAGRGNAIDPDALLKALNEEWIGGAALDVTEPEPLPSDSPLWDAKRCLITPHIAGGFHLPETLERLVRITGENFELFLSGEKDKMKNIVDHQTGYRAR